MGIAVWYSCHGQSLNFVSLEGVFLKKFGLCEVSDKKMPSASHSSNTQLNPAINHWSGRLTTVVHGLTGCLLCLFLPNNTGSNFFLARGNHEAEEASWVFWVLLPLLWKRGSGQDCCCCCLDFLHVPKCLWHAANQQLCYCDVRRSIVVCF